MQIQELQYKGYKTAEENERLRKEVEYGYAKLAKMKQEVRRLREESNQDNTVQIKG
jgi:predicted nuclease with TOPRIM domain